MPVMRAMLLLEEQMKEKRHSMGSWRNTRTPEDQRGPQDTEGQHCYRKQCQTAHSCGTYEVYIAVPFH